MDADRGPSSHPVGAEGVAGVVRGYDGLGFMFIVFLGDESFGRVKLMARDAGDGTVSTCTFQSLGDEQQGGRIVSS